MLVISILLLIATIAIEIKGSENVMVLCWIAVGGEKIEDAYKLLACEAFFVPYVTGLEKSS